MLIEKARIQLFPYLTYLETIMQGFDSRQKSQKPNQTDIMKKQFNRRFNYLTFTILHPRALD